MARKQDDGALRQHAQKGVCATHQVATYSQRKRSVVTSKLRWLRLSKMCESPARLSLPGSPSFDVIQLTALLDVP